MANSYFGGLGDVWKHLVLAEVLERESPRWYAETHAGSAAYPLDRGPRREFGIWRFLAAAPRSHTYRRARRGNLIGARPASGGSPRVPAPALSRTQVRNSAWS